MLKKLITVCLVCLSGLTFGQSLASKYIESYKDAAITQMNEHGIPASVILGIAIHESASGTSKIAHFLNNHFGMKGQSDHKKIKSAYKGYESVDESYADFINLLKNRKAFNGLFDRYSSADYKQWTNGIQRGGYAHSRVWASQVLAIISKYQLYLYDKASANDSELDLNPFELVAANQDISKELKATPTETQKTYKVKKGDTLLAIAKRFSMKVESIKQKNELKSTRLSIGQKLQL